MTGQTQYARARQLLVEWNNYLKNKPVQRSDAASRSSVAELLTQFDYYGIKAAQTRDPGLYHEALASYCLARDTRLASMTRAELYRRGWQSKLAQGYEQYVGPWQHERVADNAKVEAQPLETIFGQTLDSLRTNYPAK